VQLIPSAWQLPWPEQTVRAQALSSSSQLSPVKPALQAQTPAAHVPRLLQSLDRQLLQAPHVQGSFFVAPSAAAHCAPVPTAGTVTWKVMFCEQVASQAPLTQEPTQAVDASLQAPLGRPPVLPKPTSQAQV
jgi:hypothetical protein